GLGGYDEPIDHSVVDSRRVDVVERQGRVEPSETEKAFARMSEESRAQREARAQHASGTTGGEAPVEAAAEADSEELETPLVEVAEPTTAEPDEGTSTGKPV